jgi:hypothetical protein
LHSRLGIILTSSFGERTHTKKARYIT